ELSNLQRQVIHATGDVGTAKVESAAARVRALDPGMDVVTHRVRLGVENADLLADYDLVIDGTDNFATRYLINDTCVRLGLPEVWGSVLRFDAQVAVFWGRPPRGVPAVQLRDLFPEPPAPDQVPSCDRAGVLGALCGQVGSLMATEAVKLITGVGAPLLGRILLIDALRGKWTEVPLTGHRPEPVDDPLIEDHRGADANRHPGLGAVSEGEDLGAVTPTELADMLATQAVTVVDVREPAEHRLAAIADAISVPFDAVLAGQTDDIPPDRPVVVYCQFGVRSRRAGLALLQAGWRDVRHLTGGLDAWISQIDPSLPRY
ncbi:MAG: ThiF family adenylyltransferase, partial [Actinomycetales bacterium]|nr:ThiF family adenylyltransferase [Actinomycetales bacterium]